MTWPSKNPTDYLGQRPLFERWRVYERWAAFTQRQGPRTPVRLRIGSALAGGLVAIPLPLYLDDPDAFQVTMAFLIGSNLTQLVTDVVWGRRHRRSS